jgi:hypothetical protein
MAMAEVDDVERALALADELSHEPGNRHAIALLQCGTASKLAAEVATLLARSGRRTVAIVIHDREQAQSESTLLKLTGVGAVWVFAENLFDAFMTLFATQLAFALRRAARDGLPVVGVGRGALALGGLLVAQRVCQSAQFDLVSGLGWAQRVLLDGGPMTGIVDSAVARTSVCSLPGLLGVDIGTQGGVRVIGSRVESVGIEPILLFGANEAGKLLSLSVDPGQATTLAPPPFAPFTTGLLPQRVLDALKTEVRPLATPNKQVPAVVEQLPHGPMCPMCNKVHPPEPVAA